MHNLLHGKKITSPQIITIANLEPYLKDFSLMCFLVIKKLIKYDLPYDVLIQVE